VVESCEAWKPACRETFLPLAEALVVVRQRDAVRAVSNPVHGPQRRVVEGILTQVILQDNVGARNTRGFAKELRNVGGVVEHIHKEACVKGSIRKGELRPIECAAGKPASGPRNHFHAFDGEIGPPLTEQAADRAVAATDIEHAVHIGRNQRGQRIRIEPSPGAQRTRARWLRAIQESGQDCGEEVIRLAAPASFSTFRE